MKASSKIVCGGSALLLVLGGATLTISCGRDDGVDMQRAGHSFGVVCQAQKLSHSFRITNRFHDTMKLVNIVPSCKCTTVLVGKTTLKPRESTDLVMSFETRNYRGHRDVNTLVEGAVRGKKCFACTLVLDAIIEPVIVFPAGTQYLDLGEYDADHLTAWKEVCISRGDYPLVWDTMTCRSERNNFEVSLGTTDRDTWNLTLRPTTRAHELGTIFDELEFSFWNRGEQCEYRHRKPIVARIHGPVAPVPRSLLLGAIRVGESPKKVVTFESRNSGDGKGFMIRSVASSDPNLVHADVISLDAKPALEVTFQPTREHCGALTGVISAELQADALYTLHIDYLVRVVCNETKRDVSAK